VNTREIVARAAKDLLEHRTRLTGKADEAHRARAALEATAKAVTEHRDGHRTSAATATSHWDGTGATAFDRRAKRMTTSLDVTATAAGRGAGIVAAAARAVDGNRTAVARLIEEYTTKAATALDAGLGAKGAGAQAAMAKAIAQVRELMAHYTSESAKHLGAAQHDLRESAKQLKALEHEVEHDGIVDPQKQQRKPTDPHGIQDKIKKIARGELGYREGPGNRNKYGPAAPWCSSFASWVWRKSGVDIPITPFTGNVYHWGQQHGLAYDNHHLNQVRPGDVLLFGTGPQNPSTSKHIGIVESVHDHQVTLIEGNSGDSVRRVTHPLSGSTFYGGVHPR
jgi:cell wall-associated NlpC family hydrolase